MSIFWLGSELRKINPKELRPEMYEDRYFADGIIHGSEDYLVRVYLNDSHSETENDVDQFEVESISQSLVLKAHKVDPSHGEAFYDYIIENCVSFGCPNDGKSDFSEIFDVWEQSSIVSNDELYLWATGEIPIIASSPSK